MNQITLPIRQMVSLVHLSKNPLQFGDDMLIKPIPHGFIIVDTFAGYETTVSAHEVGDDYTIDNNSNVKAPYNWSSEGFINIYQEDDDDYGFMFEI